MEVLQVVVYRGKRYRLKTPPGRYYVSDDKRIERMLHRQIWADANGPIPKGHDIHHRDGNPLNNGLENLACLPESDHRRAHQLARMADPEFRALALNALRENNHLAVPWHSSPEGIEWHSQNGKKTWEGREPVPATCHQCGGEFFTYFPTRARHCSPKCAQRTDWRERKYHTDRRVCAFCGKEFVANRHRAAKCCSRVCANRKRAADTRV